MFLSDAYWKLRVARVAGLMMDPSGCTKSAVWTIFVETLLPLARPRSIVGEETRLALGMFMCRRLKKGDLLSYGLS